MKLKVIRYHSTEDHTLGMLLNVTKGVEFLAYTLEDEHRDVKVKGETRIPAGLMVYNTDTNVAECWNGSAWMPMF